jgi:hypothetical protein
LVIAFTADTNANIEFAGNIYWSVTTHSRVEDYKYISAVVGSANSNDKDHTNLKSGSSKCVDFSLLSWAGKPIADVL